MQVLRGVVVLHAEGDLVVHAADRVHDRRDAVKVDDHIIVRLEAHQALDLALGLVDAADGIGRVDLAARVRGIVVAHGVARDVHDVDGLFLDVHRRDHERVRARFFLVHRADDKGEHIVYARARVEQAVHIDPVAVFLVLDGRVVGRCGRTDEQGRCRRPAGRERQHDDQNDDDNAVAPLLTGQGLFDLAALFARGLGCGLRGGGRLLRRLRRLLRRCRALLCAALAAAAAASSEKFQKIFASSIIRRASARPAGSYRYRRQWCRCGSVCRARPAR